MCVAGQAFDRFDVLAHDRLRLLIRVVQDHGKTTDMLNQRRYV